eukprot:12403551-Karenia_brevis.AAC.3
MFPTKNFEDAAVKIYSCALPGRRAKIVAANRFQWRTATITLCVIFFWYLSGYVLRHGFYFAIVVNLHHGDNASCDLLFVLNFHSSLDNVSSLMKCFLRACCFDHGCDCD